MPERTEAGKYDLYYKIDGGINYNDAAAKKVGTATISTVGEATVVTGARLTLNGDISVNICVKPGKDHGDGARVFRLCGFLY